MTDKQKAKVDMLANQILGKLDAHAKMVNIDTLVYVVRQYIFENLGAEERPEAIDTFCNKIRLLKEGAL